MQVELMTSAASLMSEMQALAAEAGGEGSIAPNMINASSTTGSFGEVFSAAIADVNAQQNSAAAQMQAIEMGQSSDMVGAMISAQKAGLSFSALVQVRNKLMTGFDDVMNMSL